MIALQLFIGLMFLTGVLYATGSVMQNRRTKQFLDYANRLSKDAQEARSSKPAIRAVD